jgi:hypothetical protein
MDLLERYLATVASQLPDKQRADVIAELRDLLLSQIEEKEAELGRPLDRKELMTLLRAFGHPLVVAGRYRRFNQLIGPDVFPFYWFTLRLVLSIVVVVQVIMAAILMVSSNDPGQVFGQAVGRLIESAMITVGWVTVGFVAVEHSGAKGKLAVWNPRHLPAVAIKPRRGSFDVAMEIAMLILFIAWWTGAASWAPRGPWVHVENGTVLVISGGPMREALYGPVLWAAVAAIGISLVELVRPGWNRLNAGLGLAWHLAAIGLLVVYVRGGPLVAVTGTRPAWELAKIDHGLNLGIGIGLAVTGAIMAISAVREAWFLVRGTRLPGPVLGRA